MKRSAFFATIIGIVLTLTLLLRNDFAAVSRTLVGVGWGIFLIGALHAPQTLFAVLGWQALMEEGSRPKIWRLYGIRWVRDSINTLLPVAKLGGDVVRVRLLSRSNVSVSVAASLTIVDISLEVITQIAFTLGAVLVLLGSSHTGNGTLLALGTSAGGIIAVGVLICAQRLGALKVFDRLSARRGHWGWLKVLAGLHDRVQDLYDQPRRLLASSALHFAAWFLGIFETYAALKLLGLHATFQEALIIEALGHAVRAAGFAIPGALGVQEAGYLVICAMFQIAAPQALALAFIHRIREVILGLPGLILWHRMEGAQGRAEAV